MESVGRVVEAGEGVATVEVRRTSACEGCHKRADGGCSVCTLMGGENSRVTRTTARNPLGAKVGDRVRIESPASRVLLWAAAVFLLPLAMSAAGFAIASALTDRILWRTIGTAAGFLLCFVLLRILSATLPKHPPTAEITAILGEAE